MSERRNRSIRTESQRSPEEVRQVVRDSFGIAADLVRFSAEGHEHEEDLTQLLWRLTRASGKDQLIIKEVKYESSEGYLNIPSNTTEIARIVRTMQEDPEAVRSRKLTDNAIPVIQAVVSFVGDTDISAPPIVRATRTWNEENQEYTISYSDLAKEDQRPQIAMTSSRLFTRSEAQQGVREAIRSSYKFMEEELPGIISTEMNERFEDKDSSDLEFAVQTYQLNAETMRRRLLLTPIDTLTLSYQTVYYDPYEEREVPTESGDLFGVIKPSSWLAIRLAEYSGSEILAMSGTTHSKRHVDAFTKKSVNPVETVEDRRKFAKLLDISQEYGRFAELIRQEQQARWD